ncbi:phenazine-specific anthranilate synthase component I [Trinickia violacea]|uniref:anthranilate synthase n=1 Tax=Trinickia violacea TaxID=2571746 RepID=A0A4P8IWK7_9BURK|nr:anthranilate synthase family protein [Trinickia violacea]QCP53612.1 phenazine-specific anthranilate synthase component I [Trinickia violacea]
MKAASSHSSHDLFDRILSGQAPSFALIARSAGSVGERATIDVIAGAVSYPPSLSELPLAEPAMAGADRQELLVLVPYRQLRERGFETHDDGAPLIAITCDEHETVPVPLALAAIPDTGTALGNRHFDIDDDAYAKIVERVITDEIGTGAGSNFVIKRTLEGELDDYSPAKALAVFKRLLRREVGAYWIFVIHTGERTFVGATPERHLTLQEGQATMNPISGTYRYPTSGPTIDGINAFLGDRKESDELYMVLDEELKMMARICPAGGQVTGPHLREMTRLAHTEYFIVGHTEADVRDLLRETMFAPTVAGSPIESATRVIARHERGGRGYYSGVAALIGRDAHGERTLDSAILIRTAEIDRAGHVRIGVGSTLVRHSEAASEVMETHAKVAALSSAFDPPEAGALLGQHPSVQAALRERNEGIADFWLRPHGARQSEIADLNGRRALIIDAEDHFTAMIARQLASLGLVTELRGVHDEVDLARYDVVVMGPGPGDPSDPGDPRIVRLHAWLRRLVDEGKPFLAVCLSHQVLNAIFGIPLVRREVPNQGIQVEIDLFGRRERVGFYNTFVARTARDELEIDGVGALAISRDPRTGEVHALRGPWFSSMQFHAESVLTVDGPRILGEAITHAMRREKRMAALTA